MGSLRKAAEVTPQSTASPLPQVEVSPVKAPGPRGPIGTGPRTNYSRVNTGAPPVPEAGASSQKSAPPLGAGMLPVKTASEDSMNAKMASRLGLQDMVKAAMDGARSRLSVSDEVRRQASHGEKLASAQPQDGTVTTEYATKLAAALGYMAEQIDTTKEAAHLGGAYNLKPGTTGPGEGPNHIQVMESHVGGTSPHPGGQGHATNAHIPPKHPGEQKGNHQEHGATQMDNNLHHPPGGSGTQQTALSGGKGKLATAPVEAIKAAAAKIAADKAASAKPEEKKASAPLDQIKKAAAALKTKTAEDAINPAQISAGAAAPHSGLEAGQSAGNFPGNSGLIGSNESAIHYKKNQAKGPQKSELSSYVSEPALSGAHDKTLAEAFAHTGEAGTKFASAKGPEVAEAAVKTAAARALLEKLAESAECSEEEKKSKDKKKGADMLGVQA